MSSADTGQVVGRDPATGDLLTVRVEGGRIARVDAQATDDDGPEPYVSAGLVDLQVNGFAGSAGSGPATG
jgi:N-acetylglucosamine-6-phosphate deacetylase